MHQKHPTLSTLHQEANAPETPHTVHPPPGGKCTNPNHLEVNKAPQKKMTQPRKDAPKSEAFSIPPHWPLVNRNPWKGKPFPKASIL